MNPDEFTAVEGGLGSVTDRVTEPEDLLVLDEVVDSELVLPVWEATGNIEIDSALELIQAIDLEDIHSHQAILTQVHDRLRDVMVNLDR
jgi:hypothetical protein